ncbi:glycosyltransferase family 4 protein [Chlamydiota bacterium]
MNILIIAPTPFFIDRGCHKRIYEEARVLKNRGHSIRICTYHLGRDIPGVKIIRSLKIPWYKKVDAGPSWHKLYLDILLLGTVIAEICRNRPEVIHAHLHEGAFLGLICRAFFRIPLVADFQGSLVAELLDHRFISKKGTFFRFFQYIEHSIHKWTKSMVTSSHQAADLIKKTYSFDHTRMIPVEDGVNLQQFKPVDKTSYLRAKLGITSHKSVVIYVGILNEYQGIDYLLETIQICNERGTEVHFLIVGFPYEKYARKAYKRKLKNVTFTGRIPYEQVPEYISIADIGISPKTAETEANGKLLEYMAMGIPAIVFDSCVNREILGELGFYAKMKDSNSLANTIEEALITMGQRNGFSTMLIKRAKDRFSWESKVDIIETLYNKKLEIWSKK